MANAAKTVIGRTFGGVALGLLFGVAVFAIERGAGWLGGDGWRGVVSWMMLPLYAFGGAAVLGFTLAIGGIRRAAARLLIDSGVLRKMVERAQAKVPQPAGDVTPSGWFAKHLHATARWLVEQVRGQAAASSVERVAREKIGGWYATPVYLAWGALAVLVVVPPLLI